LTATAVRNVGVFGGAFDPPHNAHVALARAAVEQLALDELRVLPTGDAWHKARGLTEARHRLAMTGLAFAPVPRACIDDRELRRSGPTYTIDTLRELVEEQPATRWFLLMGEDQAASFASWREWAAIAALAELCVAHRGGAEEQGLARLQALPGVRVRVLALPAMPESATDVRARLTDGRDITQLVPTGVASYIERHCLYRPT
jgi:nicotinate-nucleotide adenylyltransferase